MPVRNGGIWKIIGGVAGLIAILALFVAITQLLQSQRSSNAQDFALSTQIALLQEQLEVQREMATLQASASGSGPASTLIANRLDELQSTAVALSTQEARIRQAINLVVNEDFQDGVANGFTNGGQGGDWSWDVIDDGTGNKVFQVENSNNTWSYSPFGPTEFSDGIVQFRVRWENFSDSGSGIAILNFRLASQGEGYVLAMYPYENKMSLNYFGSNSNWVLLNNSVPLPQFNKNEWYTVRLEAWGKSLQVYLNEVSICTSNDTQFSKGQISIGAGPGTAAQFDDIKVWASK